MPLPFSDDHLALAGVARSFLKQQAVLAAARNVIAERLLGLPRDPLAK